MPDFLVQARQDRPLLGIGLTLSAFFVFSCLDSSAKWLALAGIPALQIGFMRYAVHMAFSLGAMRIEGSGWSRFRSEAMGLVLLRAVALAGSSVCNFIAIRYIPLTLTATIMFSTPIMVTALSGPVLGEKVGPWRWGAIVAGFIGVIVAIRPFDADFHWAAFVSLGGACCFAAYALLTRMLAGRVSGSTMQLYGGMVGTVLLAPFALALWETPEGALNWFLLVAIGFFGWFGHDLLTKAYFYAEASALTPFNYSQIVFLGFWSVVVFHSPPDAWIMTGAAIVIAAGMTIWVRERRIAREKRLKTLTTSLRH